MFKIYKSLFSVTFLEYSIYTLLFKALTGDLLVVHFIYANIFYLMSTKCPFFSLTVPTGYLLVMHSPFFFLINVQIAKEIVCNDKVSWNDNDVDHNRWRNR